MLNACAPGVPAEENPGLVLGNDPGRRGESRDRQADVDRVAGHLRPRRVARAAHRRVHGQGGQGHHPGRSRGGRCRRSAYGDDRLFAYLRLEDAADAGPGRRRRRSREGGQARRAIRVATKYDLGEEFVRWEIATAIAGALIGHQPLQPARRRGEQDRHEGADQRIREDAASCLRRRPSSKARACKLFADAKNVAALKAASGSGRRRSPAI